MEYECQGVCGTAYLAGKVGSTFEKEQAEEMAASVKDVTKVLDRLRANVPWLRKDDAEIREDIKSQLWWSPFVDSEKITVSVDDDIATIKGTVDTWQERRLAMKTLMKEEPEVFTTS